MKFNDYTVFYDWGHLLIIYLLQAKTGTVMTFKEHVTSCTNSKNTLDYIVENMKFYTL